MSQIWEMWEFLSQGVGVWFFQRQIKLSEKTIKRYYENINRPTISKELVDTLGKSFGNQKHARDIFKQGAVAAKDGALHWEEDSFKRWVTTNQSLSVLSAFVPTLWRVFVFFARFPFTEHILNNFDGPATPYQRIDEDGFVLAHNLVALRGVELLGSTKDACTPTGFFEKSWSQKYPRLASLMFNSLKISSIEVDESFQGLISANLTNLAEEQLMNAIVLTQPSPYMSGLSFESELREVARRLLTDNAPNCEKNSVSAVSKHELQTLIQLFLLLRIEDAPWRRGLVLYQTVQRSGDIEKLAIVSDQKEILLSTRLATALIQHALKSVDSITWQSFEILYIAYPNIVFRFYELWTAIFVVHPTDSLFQEVGSGSRLSNCVVQSLSLIGPAEFDGSMGRGSPFKEDERQLRLDLQNAPLVADSLLKPALDESRLVERLTNVDWFHILVLSAEEAHETASMERTERLIALFVSPHGKQIWFKEPPEFTLYSWRYGLAQLLPHILTSQTGGLSASFQNDTIKLFPHTSPSCELSSVTVDLRNATVVVEWTDVPLLRLKLKSLKCYQMPGDAVKFTRSS